MPAPSPHLRAGPYFLSLLGLLVLLYVLVFFTGSAPTPKLGLDLRGGVTLTLDAKTSNGKAPARSELNSARQIIENRVNGRGISGSTVVTQGNNQIVVSIPGANISQLKSLSTTAQLYYRPTIAGPFTPQSVQPKPTAPATTPAPSGSGTATGSARPSGSGTASPTSSKLKAPGSPGASPRGDVIPPIAAGAAAKSTTAAAKSAGAATHPSRSAATPSSTPSAPASPVPAIPGVPADLTALISKPCSQIQKVARSTPPSKPIVACVANTSGQPDTQVRRYVMAPSILPGTDVKSAAAQYNTGAQGGTPGWSVSIDLNGHGQQIWSTYTAKHNTTNSQPTDLAADVGFVLDGQLIGDPPRIQGTINGATQVTGNFDQTQAENLANNLKYGALPLTFTQSNAESISPTLGGSQLRAGLLAGGIGLALVVLYSLLYYRALGLITISSLVVSGALVYACVVLLGQHVGFSLSLAGIAGFIVAVGITADSFVVFFERLKEEVHAGRTMRSGVERAWIRARRTILSADAVSFLAAAILYYLAAGDVRGFAFTLGLSTILDLIVVFLFTHPLISVASRSRTFSAPRMSGLGAVQRAHEEELAMSTAAPGIDFSVPESAPEASVGSATSAAERAAARHARTKES